MILSQETFDYYQTRGMPPAVQGVSLTGQVVIITGANSGIGYEAAKHFAIRGPKKLILVCRNEVKGRDTVQRLKTETGLQDLDIEFWVSDLTSFESVTSVKEKIDKLERLDILVENAGVAMAGYTVTKDGWETTLQVNVLSPAIRILLHLPKMTETAKNHPETVPRIVYVSSGAHYTASIPPEAIDAPSMFKYLNIEGDNTKPGSSQRYAESKTLAQSFIRALQPHLPLITCLSVNPGFCESELCRHSTGSNAARIRKMKEQFAYTSEEGARQVLYGAIGERDREAEIRGGWLMYSEVFECSDFLLSGEGRRVEGKVWGEVWEVARELGVVDEKIKECVEGEV